MVFDRMSKTTVFGWQKVKDRGLGKPCSHATQVIMMLAYS
jgi:hypothetical protein